MELESGDRFLEDDLGPFLAIITMKSGERFNIGVDTLEFAEEVCRDAMLDPDVRRAVSATRTTRQDMLKVANGEVS